LYRIGDSCTNVISPLFNYLPIILAFMQEYDEEAGIGTLISLMIPYSLIFLAIWSIFAMIWFAFGLPIGPGTPIFI
ncbi:MAG: AbgT family transporter, partial [Tissierellia bacterium]|nr:AbgT family transporter [Tissierellia bacterium]